MFILLVLTCVSCKRTEQPLPDTETTANTDAVTDDVTTEPALSDDEIVAIIEENLDLLMATEEEYTHEQRYIDENPTAFAKIVELGEAALPHLEAVSESLYTYDLYSPQQMRCFLAMMVAYKIDPSLYDFVCVSPDGRYSLKATVDSFAAIWYNGYGMTYDAINLIDNENGEFLTSYEGMHNTISAKWSPDSKYAVVRELVGKYASILSVFDVSNKEYYILPADELYTAEIDQLVVDSFGEGSCLSTLHLLHGEWLADNKIKVYVEFQFLSVTNPKFVRGWYIYDLVSREITQDYYEPIVYVTEN